MLFILLLTYTGKTPAVLFCLSLPRHARGLPHPAPPIHPCLSSPRMHTRDSFPRKKKNHAYSRQR